MNSISWHHLEFDEVVSTNDVCFEQARSGHAGGLWVTANRQLDGRGRRGRYWVSQAGNLYASLLLINPADPTGLNAPAVSNAPTVSVNPMMAASLPLVAAVALSRAINKVLPEGASGTKIKWPNDILINGAKVSGILIETEMIKKDRIAIVIGCGINIAHHPEQPLYPAISINQLGTSIAPQQLFSHLCREMSDCLMLWDHGRGLALVRQLWLENATGIGDEIKVNLPDKSLYGRFMGLAEDGSLILRQDDNCEYKISAGDVFLLNSD